MTPVRSALLVASAFGLALLAGCTSDHPAGTSVPPSTSTVTVTRTPTPTNTVPVSTGPTTAASATACPFAGVDFVHNTMGLRLGRLTVLTSGGRTVGCRFYPLTQPNAQCDATCLRGERLPGPNQPVVEITTQRYANANAAHNAFVLRAGTSSGVTQTDLGGVTGLCFPTDFYPKDKGTDWACTVNKGTVVVLVRTVDTAHNVGTSLVLKAALRVVTQ